MIDRVAYEGPDSALVARLLRPGEADFKTGRTRVAVEEAPGRAVFVVHAADAAALRAGRRAVDTLLAIHAACNI